MKQTLLTALVTLLIFDSSYAQRVHISAEIFANAVTAVVFTSDEYGRVIDHRLYEGSEMPEGEFISLSTGVVEAPYHLSVIVRDPIPRSYSLVNPITAVTFWQHQRDTLWAIERAARSVARRPPSGRGRFHLLITHKPQPEEETLREFGLLNFKGNKYDVETFPCLDFNIHKIGNLVNDGVTRFRFGDGVERPHIFHLQSDDDDRYREVLLPTYHPEYDDFVLDYRSLPESGSPVNIDLGNHAMRTLSVFAYTLEGKELLLGESGAGCSSNFLEIRPVVGEPVTGYLGRYEYYDVIDNMFVRTTTRQKKADFLDELIFGEVPFYAFNFDFLAHDAVLRLEESFERWRLDFTLPEIEVAAYGQQVFFEVYEYYGERYLAPGNWSVVGSSSYSSGLVSLPSLPAGVGKNLLFGASESEPKVYGISVTTESEGEQITYTLRRKEGISQPLLERNLLRRN